MYVESNLNDVSTVVLLVCTVVVVVYWFGNPGSAIFASKIPIRYKNLIYRDKINISYKLQLVWSLFITY